MSRLISLSTWLEQNYGEDAPRIDTARRWCREGRIHPLPEKHGRDYYLSPDARYVTGGTSSLVERIRGRQTAQQS